MFRKTFLVGVVALGLGAIAVSSSPASPTSCIATGPKYTANGHSTTKYGVALAGVSCAFAKLWVPRLVPKVPVKAKDPSGYPIFSIPGPPGWRCTSYDPYGGTAKPKHAYAGACVPTQPARKKFAWQPAA